MYAEEGQLAEFLIGSGLVSRSQLDAARDRARSADEPLSQILIESGAVGADELRRARANALGIPFVTLEKETISIDALALIPEPIARAHNIVGYSLAHGGIEVAVLDIADIAALDALKNKLKQKIVPRLTDSASMKRALLLYQKHLKEKFGSRLHDAAAALAPLPAEATLEMLEGAAASAAAARLVDALLRHAYFSSAAEAHLEPNDKGLLIRYRSAGQLHDAMVLPKHAASSIVLRLKSLARLRLDTMRPQDGRFKVAIEGEEFSVRISTVPTLHGEKVVVRLLPAGAGALGFTLESLGLHGAGLETMHEVLQQSSGMILVCGPEKSGKTTLLYTLLDLLNRPSVSLATIEDPIALRLPRVTQTQVRETVGLTFASGLRAILRQNPDIVMVGEIADSQTAELAFSAAQRGVLVLAALTAPSITVGLAQLREFGISGNLIASTARVVIGTRLIGKLCKNREPHKFARNEISLLEKKASFGRVLAALKAEKLTDTSTAWKDVPFSRATDCSECSGGYTGPIGVAEVIPMTLALQDALRRDASAEEIEKTIHDGGALNIMEEALFKAASGLTSADELIRLAVEGEKAE